MMEEKRNQNPDAGYEETAGRLRKMTEEIPVPPSLEPEAVEMMLRERRKTRLKRYRRYSVGAAAAACVCAAVIAGAVLIPGDSGDDMAGAESAAAPESGKDAGGEGASRDSRAGALVCAADYDEIYGYIQAEAEEQQARMYGGAIAEESASDMAAGSAADTGSTSAGASSEAGSIPASRDYSDTNVREEGVGEADIVKTDGENLYIVNGQNVEIIGIGTAEMQELSEIQLPEECYVNEIYAQAERLVILYTRQDYDDGESGYDGYFRQYTCAETYDVSDPGSPEKLGTVSQSGSYHTMRAKDGYIYVLSDFYADTAAPRDAVGAYIPEVQGKAVEAADIYMPQRQMGSSYTVIAAFSLEEPGEKTDSKAVFGAGGMCYVSGENIYITEAYYDAPKGEDAAVTQTSVRKVAYQDGTVEGAAQTKVDGTLNDSFSIDEYNGYLRLVTTVTPLNTEDGFFSGGAEDTSLREGRDTNALYVLDEDLELTGEIRDLAPDESVYSARFMGDVGYFVTFEQIDPLFSVDLSDPAAPEIIGELKIPGFSEYLHPYGDGKLLGIGMDVDEEGVTTEGVKVSMFDISDPSDVEEQDTCILEDMYGTDAGYDYRAVFVDVEKNLFGFLAYGDTGEYVVFTWEEGEGFRQVFARELNFYGNVRGLYAGERFYLVSGNTVESYTLDGFEKIDDIVL